jgi:tRNA(Arg) A34 adenosine deaminase TadA
MDNVGLILRLPAWMVPFLARQPERFPSTVERMRRARALARPNVDHGTGGPFGAAVFEVQSGQLLAAGVNLVVAAGCSVLHAEVVALILAQQRLDHFDLGAEGLPVCELVTSAEPCAMCFGALLWSGVKRLVCAARREDVERLGFDEGPKPAAWPAELRRRGIAMERDVCRAEAVTILDRYAAAGGPIYNPSPPTK